MPGHPYVNPADSFQGTQTRWVCDECHREFVHIEDAAWGAHKGENCPACGSQSIHQERFKGLFDRDTDPGLVAQLMAGLDPHEDVERRVRAVEVERRGLNDPKKQGATMDPPEILLAGVPVFDASMYVGG